MHNSSFMEALRCNNLEEIAKIPKSDIHSHAGQGGP